MQTPDGIWEAAGPDERRLAGVALNPAAPGGTERGRLPARPASPGGRRFS
jgi:hypothetical protein